MKSSERSGDAHAAPRLQAGAGTRTRERTRQLRRKGVLLVAALICIAVALMLGAAVARTALLEHQQAQLVASEQQSLWLAESGAQRARHSLRQSPDYAGETWDVPAQVLGSGSPGIVVIQVTKTTEPQAGWQVRVESRYPAESPRRVLCERTLFIAQPTNP